MPVIDNFPIEFNPKKITFLLRTEKKERAAAQAQELAALAVSLVEPKILYRASYVESRTENSVRIDSATFVSQVLRKNLENVERVFPYIVTIGGPLEERARSQDDLLLQYYLESLGDMALGLSEKHLEKQIKKTYGLKKLSSMSPGSLKNWPIEEQKPLFSLFGDVQKLIGVRLTDEMLMRPRKSVSGIFFPTEVTFLSCRLCKRERCTARTAPYDAQLSKTYGVAEE